MKELVKDSSMKRTRMIRAALLVLCLAVMTSMMPAMGLADKASAAGEGEEPIVTVIDTIDLSFATPKCGFEVYEKSGPAVKIPDNAAYTVVNERGYWYERPVTTGSSKYTGKLKGGKSYYAIVCLKVKDGNTFASTPVSGKDYDNFAGTVNLNGTAIRPTSSQFYEKDGTLLLALRVDIEHTWNGGVVTKQPTASAEGVKTYTCSGCNETKTEAIPKTAAQNGEGGSPVGRGADYVLAEKYIMSKAADYDMPGTKIAPMMLKAAKRTNKAIVLGWNPMDGAVKYTVFGTMCGKKYKMKKLGEVTGTRFKVTKIKRKLKKTYYKFVVVARDSQDKVLQTTKTVHISPKGNKKKSVYKGISLKAKVGGKYRKVSALTIARGQTTKLKYGPILFKKTKVTRHVKIRFESSDQNVATVSVKGKITGVNAGTCTIYAYTQNGVLKPLTVTVQ